jgi:hypothetical protein
MKESLIHNMDSISETTNEGRKLVQMLPETKGVSASKIPSTKNPGTPSIFSIKNNDTGEKLDLFKKFQKLFV